MCKIKLIYSLILITIFLINYQQFSLTSAYNLDLRSSVIKPGKKGTYFGYSVALYRFNRERHLLIGAPLSNGSMNVEYAGAIYKCNTQQFSGCIQVHLDKRGQEIINGTATENKTGQWLGATLVSSKSGFILACAPRYVYFSENVKRREPVGLCYLSTLSLNTDSFEYSPCRLANQWGYHRRGSCQAGFSGTISKSGQSFFITAPGSYYWQGQVYSYSRNNTNYNPIYTKERSVFDDDTYLGYSIVSDRFSEDDQSIDIALGMPRGNTDYSGKVIILDRNLDMITLLKGEKMGSYFGYALTSLDINGDKLADLVVSAPLYTNHDKINTIYDYDVGKVYIFYQTKYGIFEKNDHLNGYFSKSRFGTSLANLGDLNKDGYEDLAIGAPYEKESGTVYIFNGASTGIIKHPSQVIRPEYMPQNIPIRSFGWSLAGNVDLNNDDYPDLAVGAYESDLAIFFKSRAIIDTKVKFNLTPINISLVLHECSKVDGTQVSCTTINVCLAYNGPRSVPNTLRFIWFITLDILNNQTKPRMYVVNKDNDNLNINKGILKLEKGNYGQCNKFKAYISNFVIDKLSPIVVELQYHVYDYFNLPENSRMHTPVLNNLQPNKLYKNVYLVENCGNDNICVPDLKVYVIKNLEIYTLNSNQNIILNISIMNNGEDAYQPILHLDLPEDVLIIKIQNYQKHHSITWQEFKVENSGKNKLEFYLENPFLANNQVNFSVEICGKESTSNTLNSDFTFIFNVTAANIEKKNSLFDNILVIGIPLRVNITLEPFGQSFVNDKAIDYFLNISEFEEQIKQNRNNKNVIFPEYDSTIKHIYYLRNRGPSTIKEMNVTILWPEKTIDNKILFELIDQPNIRVINQLDHMNVNLITNKNNLKIFIQVYCKHVHILSMVNSSNSNLNILKQDTDNKIDLNKDSFEINQDDFNYYHNEKIKNLKRSKRNYFFYEPPSAIFKYNCDLNRCRKIECNIRNMVENTEVVFEISSRINNLTIRHISLDKFSVTSVLIAKISRGNLKFDSDLDIPIKINVTTIVYLINNQINDIIPLKFLLLSVIIGLLLFLLIIIILVKLDFFKREETTNLIKKLNENRFNKLAIQNEINFIKNKNLRGIKYIDCKYNNNLNVNNDLSISSEEQILNILDDSISRFEVTYESEKKDIKNVYEKKNKDYSYSISQNSETSKKYNINNEEDEDDDEDNEVNENEEDNEYDSDDGGDEGDEGGENNGDDEDDEGDEDDAGNEGDEKEEISGDKEIDEKKDETKRTMNNNKIECENEDTELKNMSNLKNYKPKKYTYNYFEIKKNDKFCDSKINKTLNKNKQKKLYSSNLLLNRPLSKHNSFRLLNNEKIYDKIHYTRNYQHYTYYRDTSYHEPTCPLFISRRSLVSYK